MYLDFFVSSPIWGNFYCLYRPAKIYYNNSEVLQLIESSSTPTVPVLDYTRSDWKKVWKGLNFDPFKYYVQKAASHAQPKQEKETRTRIESTPKGQSLDQTNGAMIHDSWLKFMGSRIYYQLG